MEQIDMFSIIEPNRFCENEDINALVDCIEEEMKLLESYGISLTKKEWSVWEHCPQFGKRLSIVYSVDEKKIPFENPPKKVTETLHIVNVDKILDFAKHRGIKLTIFPTPTIVHFMTD